MCGILLHITRTGKAKKVSDGSRVQIANELNGEGDVVPSWWDETVKVIKNRGPDVCRESSFVPLEGLQFRVCASVLALRGAQVTNQPIRTADDRLMLLWNGEVFHSTLSGFDYNKHDGVQILDQIYDKVNNNKDLSNALTSVLESVEGPYAAVLIDTLTSTVYFARDPIGRRSLLITQTDDEIVLTSSASHALLSVSSEVTEVDCKSIWRLNTESKFYLESIPRMLGEERNTILRELRKSISNDEEDSKSLDKAAETFGKVLSESVRLRVQNLRYHGPSSWAQIAVLFSGGLDCCTIALLAHQHLPDHQPIDLLNVAFQNPRVLAAGLNRDPYDVPDRLTGKQSFQELQRVAPTRSWRFVEVNVSYKEYTAAKSTVEKLINPCTSVMDLSIGSALYFASKANTESYKSTAKVLLSGLGADELLGGYSRHRRAWQSGGFSKLVQELQMDIDRLPTRNLGRDDRIISQNGKEARYPFLDREVIRFLSDLPVQHKVDFSFAPGKGDKMILRRLADRLGLQKTSVLTKKAIQFGAQSAKMEAGDSRKKGHEQLTKINIDP